MRYKLLGKSGLRVSELALGTMTFGDTWGWGATKEVSRQLFDHYADQGGNFIDTSVNYTDGTSEQFIGEFLQGRRDNFVVATKYTLTDREQPDPNQSGNSRKNMMHSVERSLKNLQTDYIDVLYLHMWDFMTPIEEVMMGLERLVQSGKVLYVAISDSPAWVVSAANMLSELRGWSRFVGLQIPYNIASRHPERSLLPMAKHWDMAVLAWGLLGSGVLTGKFRQGVSEPTRVDPETLTVRAQTDAILDKMQEISEEIGRPLSQIAINWVRQQQHRAVMIPIIGARTMAQLEDNLAVLEWELSDEHLAELHEVSKIDLGFPHGFLNGNSLIFGATFDQIDNHRDSNPIDN